MLAPIVAAALGALTAAMDASTQLRLRGFTVLPDPIAPPALLAAASASCTSRLDALLAQIDACDCDSREELYSFREICHRQLGRWDLAVPGDEDDPWRQLCELASAAATPVIHRSVAPQQQLSPNPTTTMAMGGAVVSRAGALAQPWHADASEAHFERAAAQPGYGLYTVFVPLVPIAADGDGTQFVPRSHLRRSREPTRGAGAEAALEAPACPAGGAILFDYRVTHRGLANPTRERPVAYAVVSTGGAHDGDNFPRTRLRDVHPGHMAQMMYG